jgi:hypothetical protein
MAASRRTSDSEAEGMTGVKSRARHLTREFDGAERRRLLESARSVLDGNWLGASTVPSRTLYPHQWSWDSAFIAIGQSWYDQQRAQLELETLFEGQWSNGMVPHIVFNPDTPPGAYFPGPEFWQSERADGCPSHARTSGITQPPLHARAALEVYEHATDRESALAFLQRIYPKLVAQHEYLASRRDAGGRGLASIVHPWESGLDNSPAWDRELDGLLIPAGALPPYERRDLVHADAADRPSDEAYDRFVYLAVLYREADYDDERVLAKSPFLIEGPLFNAIYLWSTHALVTIAEMVGADPRPHRAAAERIHNAMLERLWNPRAERFCALDARGVRRDPEATIISYMQLLDPDLPAEIVSSLVSGLNSPHFHPEETVEHYLMSSFDLGGSGFDPRRYWRGPVWLNTNWLLWRGLRSHGEKTLASEIADSMLTLVRRSGFREYFDPFGGQGYGSTDFSWTAALLIDLLHREP